MSRDNPIVPILISIAHYHLYLMSINKNYAFQMEPIRFRLFLALSDLLQLHALLLPELNLLHPPFRRRVSAVWLETY